MIGRIHDVRTEVFRRILRATGIAVSKGCRAIFLRVPATEDPEGFLEALHRYVLKKALRPCRLIDLRPRPGERPSIRRLATALGLTESPFIRPDEPIYELAHARIRIYEYLRTAMDREVATSGDSPGLLLVHADWKGDRTLRGFATYLARSGSVWPVTSGRDGAFALIGVIPDGRDILPPDGVECIDIPPISEEDLRNASSAVAEWLQTMLRGEGSPPKGEGVGEASSPDSLGPLELLRDGAVDEAVEAARGDKALFIRCLAASGRFDEIFALAKDLEGKDLAEVGLLALRVGQTEEAIEIAKIAQQDPRCTTEVLQAEVALVCGDLDLAEVHGRRATNLATTGPEKALAYNTLGKVLFRQSRLHLAEAAFTVAKESVHPDHIEAVRALHNLGLVALGQYDYTKAADLLQQALVASEESGAVMGAALAHHNLAISWEHQGRYGLAFKHALEAVKRFERIGAKLSLGFALHTVADLLITFGEFERAKAFLEKARSIGKECASGRLIALAQRSEGEILLSCGCPEEAVERLEEGHKWFATHNASSEALFCLVLMAEALLEAGHEEEAKREAEKVLSAVNGKAHEVLGRAYLVQGRILLRQEKAALALEPLNRACDELKRSRQRLPLAESYRALALALERLGNLEAAKGLREEAEALLSEVVKEVPEEFRKAAQARLKLGSQGAPRAMEVPRPRENENIRMLPRLRHLLPHIVGESEALNKVLIAIERLRDVKVPVLFVGESGTGKELFADALHRLSSRSKGPFIKVNAAAFPDSLLLSELFGHEKGAFTDAHTRKVGKFEAAHGGTLFLDEIGDISEHLQVALLRVLEEQAFQRLGGTQTISVDVRLIFATNRDLEDLVRKGRFREDLYHRIAGVKIEVPPLRERLEDIPGLVRAFLEEVERETGRKYVVTEEALELLRAYRWPGNIRELKNVLRRTCLLMNGHVLDAKALRREFPEIGKAKGSFVTSGLDPFDLVFGKGMSLFEARREVEVALIREALLRSGGNIAQAARILGMKRPRLSQMVKEYGLKEEFLRSVAGEES